MLCEYEPGVTYAVVLAQLVGALLTGYGLLTTWQRYTGRRTLLPWLRDSLARLRRKREPVTPPRQSVSFGDSLTFTDSLSVTVKGSLTTRVEHLEKVTKALSAALERHEREARDYADGAARAVEARMTAELARLAESIPEETRRVALDGLGLAAIGLAVTALATFVSLAVVDCPS